MVSRNISLFGSSSSCKVTQTVRHCEGRHYPARIVLALPAVSYSFDKIILLFSTESKKITVELSGSEIKEICRVTGEKKKGPAIRKLVVDALMLKRREKLALKFIDAEWGVELKDFEANQVVDRAAEQQNDERWRQLFRKPHRQFARLADHDGRAPPRRGSRHHRR